jgi:multidrug efflux pump subunit AcrB
MGIAGRIAQAFLRSKLTPLVTLASLAVGLLGILATPREEEPQISVPMIDVMSALPGISPKEAENLLARPIERRMLEIPGVEHVYSMAGDGYAIVTVRFKVGEDQERSVTKVQAKLAAAADDAPPGALPPVIKPHSIDDVPVLGLTVHSAAYDANMLRQLAVHLEDEIRTVPDVATTFVVGGQPKQFRVMLDPARLAASGVTPGEVAAALRGANARLEAGELASAGQVYRVDVGAPLSTPAEVSSVVVGVRGGAPVYLRNVADVTDGFGETTTYVSHHGRTGPAEGAVTIAVAKRRGANATAVTHAVMERVNAAADRLVPRDVSIDVTRDYGETAGEKARELILHLLIATVSVTLLIWLFLGWREAAVVMVAVPVTLALTLFAYYTLGYTLNRITLFALIFSIGILVDDAIVVVENIYRHMRMGDRTPEVAAIEAVDEVGNPTILATFTVIAAILPMAFVSGMMGPYMRPIPIGASVAMLASLAVAFIVTPYLAYRLLKGRVAATARPHDRAHEEEEASRFARLYRRVMTPLMDRRRTRLAFYGGVAVLLLVSMGLVLVKAVKVKMLPFDNKSEFQVVLDLPEGTTLETSNALGDEIAGYLRRVPEVKSTEVYAGTAAPFNFNGLVRHYFLRAGSNVADVQVNLVGKGERSRQSHEIAVAVRPGIDSIARRYHASAKVAEIPPGPPVLSTLVAEVYAPSDSARLEAARRVREVFETTPGVVDVDWTVDAPQQRSTFRVDRVRAADAGVSVEQITQTLYLALSGTGVGIAASPTAREGAPIVPRLPLDRRSSIDALLALPIATSSGPQPFAQGSPAGDLRHRRRRGRHRVAGLRDSGDEPEARRDPRERGAHRTLQRGAAVEPERDGDQVGRRMAGDDRGVSRSRARVRHRARADLRARRRVVPVVQDPARDHGADSTDADRHPARARGQRGVLHGDVDDRHDRARRDHRTQLHPARRLHPTRRGPRAFVARRRPRGGRRSLSSDRVDGRRGGRRRPGDGARSDLPGTRRGADERRGRRHAAHDGRRSNPLLGPPPPGSGGASRTRAAI